MAIDNPEFYRVRIELPKTERDLILKHTHPMNAAAVEPFRLGAFEGNRLIFTPTLPELEDLVDLIRLRAHEAESRTVRRRLIRLLDKLDDKLQKYERGIRINQASGANAQKQALVNELHRRLAVAGVDNMEDAKNELRRLQDEYNHRPMPDYAGLSPHQIRQLLSQRNWTNPSSAMLLNEDLSENDTGTTPMIANTRIFLDVLREQGGTPATTAGNLNRRFVQYFFDHCVHLRPHIAEMRRKYTKVYNELDLWDIHIQRVLLELAGYVRKYKRRFVATKRAEEVFDTARVGAAYTHLFLTFFNKLDLDYSTRMLADLPEVQDDVAYSIYQIGQLADDWILEGKLACEMLTPAARAAAVADEEWEASQILHAASRILRPLELFGVIEKRLAPEEDEFDNRHSVRKTPLFDKLFTFRL